MRIRNSATASSASLSWRIVVIGGRSDTRHIKHLARMIAAATRTAYTCPKRSTALAIKHTAFCQRTVLGLIGVALENQVPLE